MSAHTPGPWYLNQAIGTGGVDCGWHVEPECIDFKYRGVVASLYDAEHIDGITKTECDANARLIAAAPDLLAALRQVLAHMPARAVGAATIAGAQESHDKSIFAARAAIASATGEVT